MENDFYYSENQIQIFFLSWLRSIHELEDTSSPPTPEDSENLIDSLADTLAEFAENAKPNDIVKLASYALHIAHVFSSRLGLTAKELDDSILTPTIFEMFKDE